MSTATIMFAANLTVGLYVHFGPKPLTPNSTMGLESIPLGGTEQPLATPSSYLTLVPLVATMLFITGGYGSATTGMGLWETDGQLAGGYLLLRCVGDTLGQGWGAAVLLCQGVWRGAVSAAQWRQKRPLVPSVGRLRHGLGAHHLAPHVGDPAPAGPWRGLGALRASQLAHRLCSHQVLPAGGGE